MGLSGKSVVFYGEFYDFLLDQVKIEGDYIKGVSEIITPSVKRSNIIDGYLKKENTINF